MKKLLVKALSLIMMFTMLLVTGVPVSAAGSDKVSNNEEVVLTEIEFKSGFTQEKLKSFFCEERSFCKQGCYFQNWSTLRLLLQYFQSFLRLFFSD